MLFVQTQFSLARRRRGVYLVTDEVLAGGPDFSNVEVGFLQLFLQHTSASLTLNENADPTVREDMETALDRLVPEEQPFLHTCEGPDDMPAHVKSSMFGAGLLIPISAGRLCLGTWQGIYLCEHRNAPHRRNVVATVFGNVDNRL